MVLILAFCFTLVAQLAQGWFYGRPDPGASTQGEVWPLPWKVQNAGGVNHTLNAQTFKFTTDANPVPEILQKAFARYQKWMFPEYKTGEQCTTSLPTLTSLKVTVDNAYDGGYPQLGMDESYTLTIPATGTTDTPAVAELHAPEIWGALRGLESFSQLVYQTNWDFQTSDELKYSIRATTITDHPRFPHRGTMIDSSRHFLTVNTIKRHLDLMAQNKMNVLHWHLVDSEAFPYPSEKFPNLTKGAYTPRHVYTRADIQTVIDFAKNRGIRVIAEFDTPGHMGAWGPGQPGLLSKCYDSHLINNIDPNIIDPSKPANFDFLKDFFTEALTKTFKDDYMHFGGDEVSSYMLQCWQRNPDVRKWMNETGFGDDTYKVLDWYFQQLFTMVHEIKPDAKMVVWQEVLDNNVNATGTIAHVWKGSNYEEMMAEMQQVTAAGHDAILSSCWYLNLIKYGNDWGYLDSPNIRQRGLYYECDPTDFEGTDEQKKHVLGGEATMWAEFVDGTNLIQRMWPRASAVAERLWSDPAQTTDEGTRAADKAWPRLHEHKCRMLRRGYPVQPINNPNYCPLYWDPQFPDQMD